MPDSRDRMLREAQKAAEGATPYGHLAVEPVLAVAARHVEATVPVIMGRGDGALIAQADVLALLRGPER